MESRFEQCKQIVDLKPSVRLGERGSVPGARTFELEAIVRSGYGCAENHRCCSGLGGPGRSMSPGHTGFGATRIDCGPVYIKRT
jgi:hypothetical protein